MSDLATAKQKIKKGADWRGTVTLDIDGDTVELCVRQLRDVELEEVMGLIDRDELENLRDEYPDEVRDELDELRSQDDLSEEEEERLSELQEQMEDVDVDVFSVLSDSTFEGVRKAAMYGVEPDEDDMATAMRERAHEIEKERGIQVQTPEDTHDALKEEWQDILYQATDFVSFEAGMEVLMATVGEEGNSEN